MEMGFGLSKQTWRMGPREQEPAHTHSHPRAPVCCDLDPPQERWFDWPTEIGDGLQNTLDAQGESCQEHTGMFYL